LTHLNPKCIKINVTERRLSTEIPYIPFTMYEPIQIDGSFAYKYIEPRLVSEIVHSLADKINFKSYDAVLVNMHGGMFLYEELARVKGYTGPFYEVEYHRPDSGVGTKIVKRVPRELRGRKCLVVDDIADRKTTFRAILNDLSKDSLGVALVTKRGIRNQARVNNILIGIETDNEWLGGCGMNIDYKDDPYYPKNAFRNYPGIVVRPQKHTLARMDPAGFAR